MRTRKQKHLAADARSIIEQESNKSSAIKDIAKLVAGKLVAGEQGDRVFYRDPMVSLQKAACEEDQVRVHKMLPEGSSSDRWDGGVCGADDVMLTPKLLMRKK